MIKQAPNSNDQKFNLEHRTKEFSKEIIKFCKMIKADHLSRPIISQLIRSATSIGANYCEANECNSKKDFQHKISIAKKEAKETMYWLEMAAELDKNLKEPARKLWQEAHELVLIFSSILKK